jgi:hypothetical protein
MAIAQISYHILLGKLTIVQFLLTPSVTVVTAQNNHNFLVRNFVGSTIFIETATS